MNSINFKKWAFHFTIWNLIINVITLYLTVTYVNFPGIENNTIETLIYFGLIGLILLFLTIIAIIFSTIKKEKRNYQYWASIVGILIFGILPMLSSLIA